MPMQCANFLCRAAEGAGGKNESYLSRELERFKSNTEAFDKRGGDRGDDDKQRGGRRGRCVHALPQWSLFLGLWLQEGKGPFKGEG